MKKTIAILLALCLCIGLCACSEKGTQDHPTETKDSQPVDYYQQLLDYVTLEGSYEDGVTYIYKTAAANEDLMLIADNNVLRYWYTAEHRTGSTSFYLSYELIIKKGVASSFTFDYVYVSQYSNGIAIDGENAKLTGSLSAYGDDLTIITEKYTACEASTIREALTDCHEQGVRFIEDIMAEAGIDCTFRDLRA